MNNECHLCNKQNVMCTSRLLILLTLLFVFAEIFFTFCILVAVILLLHVAPLVARLLQTAKEVVHERDSGRISHL